MKNVNENGIKFEKKRFLLKNNMDFYEKVFYEK